MNGETGKEQVQNEKLKRAESWLDEQVQDLADSAPGLHLMIKLFRKGDERAGEQSIVELGYGKYITLDEKSGVIKIQEFVPVEGKEGYRDTEKTVEFNLSSVSNISTRLTSIQF